VVLVDELLWYGILGVKELLHSPVCLFTCGMLQSQITAYNELIHADGITDVEVFGYQLADWIIKNNVVEQIFGPNLHVEVGTSVYSLH